MSLSTPTAELAARSAIELLDRRKFRVIEDSLARLFSGWPRNHDLATIHLKVVALNSMYSTQIYDTLAASEHIHALDIDERLSDGDLSIVANVADMSIGGKLRRNTSFASKYCSWHRPDHYYIYDSYVDDALWYFRNRDAFADFRRFEMKSYPKFSGVLKEFTKYYGLEQLTNKQLDQYLWLQGEQLRDIRQAKNRTDAAGRASRR